MSRRNRFQNNPAQRYLLSRVSVPLRLASPYRLRAGDVVLFEIKVIARVPKQ